MAALESKIYMEEEIWLPIVGYEGLYDVSNLGNIKSLSRKYLNAHNNIKNITGFIMKQITDCDGYKVINLCKNGKKKMMKVHRLVAMSFIPNPENKPCIDHIDTNRCNNNYFNLKWCTYKENQNNEITKKLVHFKNKHVPRGNSKPILELCLINNSIINRYTGIKEVIRELHITKHFVFKTIKNYPFPLNNRLLIFESSYLSTGL